MTYFIVTNDNGESQLIEASNAGEAISHVPGADRVRLALGREIQAHFASQVEQDEEE